MTLEGQLEGLLVQAVRGDPAQRHTIEPDLGRRIVDALQRAAQPLVAEAKPFALVVQPAIRVAIRKLVKTCRSEEHPSELQSLMRISYAVFCLKKTKNTTTQQITP